MHEFVQNSLSASFQPEIRRFCDFCTLHTTLERFSAKCTSLWKLMPEICTFCHFRTECTTFKRFSASDFQQMIFSKVHGLYTTAVSARYHHVFSFFHRGHHFLEFSVKCTVCTNQRFQPDISTFLIFALGTPLFSVFQQSERVCSKHSFQPGIRRFCDFCTLHTTL